MVESLRDIGTDPARILHPVVRESFLRKGRAAGGAGRGREPFVRVSWDAALDLAAAELDRVRAEHGNEAIYGGSYGWASAGRFHHAQSQVHRFLNTIGGYTRSVQNYSFAAADIILPHVIGDRRGLTGGHTSWTVLAGHAGLIVMFGGAPRRLVIDNLKAAVPQADWYDPEIHPKLRSFAVHYGTAILPTRP